MYMIRPTQNSDAVTASGEDVEGDEAARKLS